jgi:hypothetical protein
MVIYQHITANSASAEVIVPPGAGKTLIGVGVYQLHAAMYRTASLCLVLNFSVESTRQFAAEAARLTHCGVHTEVTAIVNAAEAAAYSAAHPCADDDASDSDSLSSTAATTDAAAAAVPAVVQAATTDSSESGHAAVTAAAASTVSVAAAAAAFKEHDITSDVRSTTLSVVIISMQRLHAMLKSSECSIRAAALVLMQQCDSCVIDESHHVKTAKLWRQITARIADRSQSDRPVAVFGLTAAHVQCNTAAVADEDTVIPDDPVESRRYQRSAVQCRVFDGRPAKVVTVREVLAAGHIIVPIHLLPAFTEQAYERELEELCAAVRSKYQV